MPFKPVVTAENYNELKEHCTKYGVAALRAKYNIGGGTSSYIKTTNSFEEYQKKMRESARRAYSNRRERIKAEVAEQQKTLQKQAEAAASNPFGNAKAPEPVIPVQEKVELSKNGPVTTRQAEVNIGPMTLDQYRRENEELKAENQGLKEQVVALKRDKRRLEEYGETMKSHYISAITKEPEQKMTSTKVEITVGSAHIVISDTNSSEPSTSSEE